MSHCSPTALLRHWGSTGFYWRLTKDWAGGNAAIQGTEDFAVVKLWLLGLSEKSQSSGAGWIPHLNWGRDGRRAVWLCGLGLTKLVPEWDIQTVSPHSFPYIFSYIFLCLEFNFYFFRYLSVLPAVTGGCRERWGWFCGGGLLLDPSDGGMSSAPLLGRHWNLVAVAGLVPVDVCTEVFVSPPVRAQNMVLAVDLLYFLVFPGVDGSFLAFALLVPWGWIRASLCHSFWPLSHARYWHPKQRFLILKLQPALS